MRGRVTNAKWQAENNEKRETATRLLGVETSLASRTHSSKKGKEGSGNSLAIYAVHQTLPFFTKEGLACKIRLRREKRR